MRKPNRQATPERRMSDNGVKHADAIRKDRDRATAGARAGARAETVGGVVASNQWHAKLLPSPLPRGVRPGAGAGAGAGFVCYVCGNRINAETLFLRHGGAPSTDTHYYSRAQSGGAKKMCGPCGNKKIVVAAERAQWNYTSFKK